MQSSAQELFKLFATAPNKLWRREVYFVYGQPNFQRLVRCYWRNRQYTDEERAFLDRLQGSPLKVINNLLI